jgi:serine/threonine-protein kinase RsbW
VLFVAFTVAPFFQPLAVMTDNHWSWTLDRRIPSDTAIGSKVIEELLRELNALRWSEHDVFGIHLAVEEAIVNAIKHGNRYDADKQVHVVFKLSANELYIQIEDQGGGFDPDQVPDPTDDRYLDRACGRGVMLMRHYMNEIEYNGRGNRVEMKKERQLELN